MEISASYEQARVPVTVFHVKGNITGNTYQQFEDTVRDAIKGGAQDVLLDLTEVGYIDQRGTARRCNTFFRCCLARTPNTRAPSTPSKNRRT